MARSLFVTVLLAQCVWAQDDSAERQAELAKRLADFKRERKAHTDALARAVAERSAALKKLNIIEVARLGKHADPARSLDVVFIGDGLDAADQKSYTAIVDRMASNFDTPPFSLHKSRVNLYRVNLVSPVSGIGDGTTTPLGGHVKKFVGGRLLANDMPKTIELVRAAVPDVDYIMAVLNNKGPFGSANTGRIVRLSTSGGHQRSIVMHEFGHNFVGLLDEYVDKKQSGTGALPLRLKHAINAGLEKNVYVAKWHYFNIPASVFFGSKRGKPFKVEDNVRCYEGGATFNDGVYRAEENCHMQRGRGKAYCRVCSQAMELGMYRFLAPIESVHPYRAHVVVGVKKNLEFKVVPPELKDPVRSSWYLDGRRLNPRKAKAIKPRGFAYKLTASDFGRGVHYLTVRIDIDSPRVWMDHGRQSSSFTWTVEVPEKPVAWDGPRKLAGVVGEAVDLELADGWTSDVTFPWTPHRPGAYRFTLKNKEARAVVDIVVKPNEKRSNKPPKFLFLPPPMVREGQKLAFTLEAYDPDADHLAWTSKSLPPRARLDAATGRFEWDVGFTQRGRYELEFAVTDGAKRAKLKLMVSVAGAPLFRGILRVEQPEFRDPTDRMLVALQHPLGSVRLDAAKGLEEGPWPQQLAASLRLLRESNEELAGWALESLKSLAGRREVAYLDMFLDVLARSVWQLADRPEVLKELRTLCVGATPGAARTQKKELKALLKDLDVIDAYNKKRNEREPKPPITDKRYR